MASFETVFIIIVVVTILSLITLFYLLIKKKINEDESSNLNTLLALESDTKIHPSDAPKK